MTHTELSERNIKLLTALVDRYIRDGVPVGSKTLSRDSALALSPASIRNIMAELEEAGLICSPHTSAGRVPTDLGYRLFVDRAVTASAQQDAGFADEIREHLKSDMAPSKLAESASNLLSAITSQAGVVLLLRIQSPSFRQLEFLPLAQQRVLVILVLNEKDVQNRIIYTDRNYSEQELHRAASFINDHFGGRSIEEARYALLQSMREDKSVIDELMETAIEVAAMALDEIEQQESDCVIAGQANLLGDGDRGIADMARLRELFEAFQQKKDILHLMERCAQAEGVQIFIGEESGYEVLDDFSVIAAPYTFEGQSLGVLGVIGPTRMAYKRVVPLVDITAKLLSAALKN